MGGESFDLLDAQVVAAIGSPLEPTVRCVGRGAGDGCGHEGGNSGDVCPSCGGMLLSNEAAAKAAQLAAYWIAENAPNAELCGGPSGTGFRPLTLGSSKRPPCNLRNTDLTPTPPPAVQSSEQQLKLEGI